MVSPHALAVDLLAIIHEDKRHLEHIDNYLHGKHADPYMPKTADAEYKLLAKRAISNWMPLLVSTPAQAMYVDGFRPSKDRDDDRQSPEWEHWQGSRLDARQAAVHRAALTYGHSFTLTEKNAKGEIRTKGLSPMRTSALYEDQANDNDPHAALTILSWPDANAKGVARMWDATNEYKVTFTALLDEDSISVTGKKAHGAPECPVTRFASAVDLEGRTVGVIEPLIPLQDRINQTVFDLLVSQTYGSFKVRYATGMAPPLIEQWFDEAGKPVRSAPADTDNPPAGWTMRPTPAPMDHNARRFLFAEDSEARFGSLDETPLDGFISSIEAAIRQLAAISQTPPHHILGQIANLSADALIAAENALARKVEEFRKAFGESWERVFRLAGALAGDMAVYEDVAGEVLWRDVEQRSLAQSADALGKLADQLSIPKRGLWSRVPNVTQTEIDRWMELREEDDYELQMAEALNRASSIPASKPADPSSNTNSRGNLTQKEAA